MSHHSHLVMSDVISHHHNDMVIRNTMLVKDLVSVAHIGLREEHSYLRVLFLVLYSEDVLVSSTKQCT